MGRQREGGVQRILGLCDQTDGVEAGVRRDIRRRRIYKTLSYSKVQLCSLSIGSWHIVRTEVLKKDCPKKLTCLVLQRVSLIYQSEQAGENLTLSSRT